MRARQAAIAEPGEEVPLDILKTWILESYQAIAPKPKRVPGRWKGQFTIAPEFFDPMTEEELELWYK